MEPTENKLVGRATDGDYEAFAELVTRSEAKVYGHLLRMVGNPEDARELLQETYLSAYKNLPKFEGKSKFSTWVYRIATNHALMKLRKKTPDTVEYDEITVPTHEELKNRNITDWNIDPATAAQNSEIRDILNESIAKLPPQYRTVVILRDLDGLDTGETAQILDISPGAVKTRLHRARLHLRELIAPHFEIDETSGVK